MSTKDRKLIEKENRRDNILAAAENVMKTHGIHGLSIDLIANETQLAKGTIYLYFKSKEEILSTLSVKARKLLFKEMHKIENKGISPIEQIREVVKTNYAFYKKSPLYYDLVSLYEVNNTHTETEEMYEAGEDFTKLVTGFITRAKEDGSLNQSITPLYFTFCLWGMIVGMLQLVKVRGAIMQEKMNLSEEDLLNTFIECLENGIKSGVHSPVTKTKLSAVEIQNSNTTDSLIPLPSVN
jgi:TetR/AcrR family transcriptional regulator